MSGGLPSPYYNPGDSVQDVLDKLPGNINNLDTAVAVPGSKREGYSPVYRHKLAVDGFAETIHPDIRTVYDVFESAVQRLPTAKYLAFRKSDKENFTFLTYREVADLRTYIGSGILHLLQKFTKLAGKSVVTYYLPNCPEFALADLATSAYSLVNTCIYDTLGVEAFSYIIELTESPFLITSKSKVELIASLNIKPLKFVITVDELDLAEDHELFNLAQKANFLLLDLASLIGIGKNNVKPHIPPSPEDTFSISFTSGTTSMPKGCITSHKMEASQLVFFLTASDFPKKGRSYIFLPLAHVYSRSIFICDTFVGNVSYFPTFPGNVPSYFKDIKDIAPTSFFTVPRVLNRIEQTIHLKVDGSPKLIDAINYKIKEQREGRDGKSFFYDSFVAPKIRKLFGFQHIQVMATGSAAIANETLYFLRAALNINITQGLGFTEIGGGACLASDKSPSVGTNGALTLGFEMKFKDVPEMNYTFAKSKSGELLLRGPMITTGYYKQQEKFEETLDEEGWYRTGDICQLDENNRLLVLDRVKNFFKLSNGKFIASEKIQNTYLAQSSLVEQIFVHGSNIKAYIVAIIGLSLENLKLFLAKNDVDFNATSLEEVLKLVNSNHALKSKLLYAINDDVRPAGLMPYELIKNAHFAITPFSVENGTYTPTMKIKRPQVKSLYGKELDGLYEEGILLKNFRL